MKDDFVIKMILYVAENEGLTPEQVLWGIVPIENRHIVYDGCLYEQETETKTRSSGEQDSQDDPISRQFGGRYSAGRR